MQPTDFNEFAELLGKVAIAHSRDLDPPTIQLFFKALQDVPLRLLHHAGAELIRHGDRWVPPAGWRKVVDEVQERLSAEERKALLRAEQRALPGTTAGAWDPATQRYEDTVYCRNCWDTGWRAVCGCPRSRILTALDPECVDLKNLGHCKEHGGHAANGLLYPQPVKACECRASNPIYLKTHPATPRRFSKPSARRRRTDGE